MSSDNVNPFASPPLDDASKGAGLAILAENGNWPLRPTEIAEIVEIPPPRGRKVLTSWNFAIAAFARYWGCTPLLVVLAIRNYDSWSTLRPAPSPLQSLEQFTFWMIAAILPLLFLLSNLWVPFGDADMRLSKKLAATIRRRPHSCVPRPKSPLARYVAIMPQEPWHLKLSHRPQDVAYMKVDPPSQSIYLEGDRYRYRIPYRSLFDCHPMSFTRYTVQVCLVRLVYQTETGPEEIFLRPGDIEGFLMPNNRRRRELAEAIHLRIMQLKPSTLKAPPRPIRQNRNASPGWGMAPGSIGPEN